MWTRAVLSRFLFLWLLPMFIFSSVLATPLPHSSSLSPGSTHLRPRQPYILRNNTITGTLHAINPDTSQLIPQGPATDGSGKGLDAPAAIWMVFALLTGIPLSFVGIRGWRMTTGLGVGLATAVVSWASFVNTISATGIADIFLTAIVLVFFAAGFIFGCFEIGRIAGMVLLGILGSMSFGVRLMLLRPGLLFGTGDNGSGTGFILGWVMIALLGALGGVWIVFARFQRSGMLFACAATGTFLISLGVDLILNEQTGMSGGLIFLFDRNSSHIVDVITKGYKPSMTTQVILGSSLALIPILSFAQHKLFKAPFDRRPGPDSDSLLNSPIDRPRNHKSSNGGLLVRHRQNASNLFSGMWDGALFREKSPNRFSI